MSGETIDPETEILAKALTILRREQRAIEEAAATVVLDRVRGSMVETAARFKRAADPLEELLEEM